MNLKRMMQYAINVLKRDPELKFVQQSASGGSSSWTLINTGAATIGDILVAEFGTEDRLINYVNIGPVAANTEVTLPFSYCITLRAEYTDSKGKRTLMCHGNRNNLFDGPARPLYIAPIPFRHYPGITKKELYA